jgi:ATP-dependent DNA helicase
MYSSFLKELMDQGRTALRTATPPKPSPKTKPKAKGKQNRRQSKPGRKRARVVDDDDESDEENDAKKAKLDSVEVEGEAPLKFQQPSLVTGATLKDYQLDGVEWMVSLDQNGASGILGANFFQAPSTVHRMLTRIPRVSGRDGTWKSTHHSCH